VSEPCRYWNERIETLPRERLRALQERRLRRLLGRVAERSEFYRQKLGAEACRTLPLLSLEEFQRLPLTTKEELRAEQARCAADGRVPYAGLLCVPPSEIRVERTTSGTTGTPLIVPLTEAELDESSILLGEIPARGFCAMGLGRGDVILYCWGMGGTTVGGAANFLPIGALPVQLFTVVPGHTGRSRLQLETMRELRVTVLYATPSYTRYLAELARSTGIDPRRDLAVRRLLVSGEAGPIAIPAMRAELEAPWGAQCYDFWGQLESRTRAFECAERNGAHVAEDFHLYEVLDPATYEPVPPGRPGVLVVTYLLAEAMPILRYDTRDVVALDETVCACGRTGARLVKILGRADDMVKVRGLRFFPSEVLGFVQAIEGVAGLARIVLDRDDLGRDVFTVQLEYGGDGPGGRALAERVRREVREAIGLEPGVEVVAPGALERSMLKTPPVLDLRDAAQRERYAAAMAGVRAF
jgi:phenylacetate-CoA ligase